MSIRAATLDDIPRLCQIDQAAYGQYGEDEAYFRHKFQSFPEGILVMEEERKVTGFAVVELLKANELPSDFCDFEPHRSLEGKWMHIIAFTTSTNYKDSESDRALVEALERTARKAGCASACVPLTKNHPFEKHGVFDFWEANGYLKEGEIRWIASPSEKLECYFYRKDL